MRAGVEIIDNYLDDFFILRAHSVSTNVWEPDIDTRSNTRPMTDPQWYTLISIEGTQGQPSPIRHPRCRFLSSSFCWIRRPIRHHPPGTIGSALVPGRSNTVHSTNVSVSHANISQVSKFINSLPRGTGRYSLAIPLKNSVTQHGPLWVT